MTSVLTSLENMSSPGAGLGALRPPSLHQSPRPSPTKRAHSSPELDGSPTLGGQQHDPDQSPRVSRTKLSNDSLVAASPIGRAAASASATSSAARREGPPSWTPPAATVLATTAGGGLVGLGVENVETNPVRGEREREGLAPPALSAQEQTRKLMEMPVEMSSLLSRLSSQHHLSQYNVLKRVVAASLASPPMLPSSPTPLPPATSPRINPSKLWSNPLRQPQSNERDSNHGSRSVPSVSRAATPPPKLTSSTSADVFGSTSLTPTFSNFAFSPPPKSPTLSSSGSPQLGANGTSNEVDVAVALDDALRTTLDRSPASPPTFTAPTMARTTVVHNPVPVSTSPPLLPGMQVINGYAVKTSASHPMNISPILPPEFLPILATQLFGPASLRPRSPLMPSFSLSSNFFSKPPVRPFVVDCPPSCDLWELTAATLPLPPLDATGGAPAKPFGNFLLSSCPGKKVRLGAAPVKGGRSGICRDLKMDLQRAKDEGVRLIICCLDDQELGYLGAPWEEYSAAAQALSLAVIRIPMVEGFAPASPAELDAHLARIIRCHSLRGEAVLAHCRGGIGRAGLVSCCWMIKCGLLGLDLSLKGDAARVEAMRIVERVIEVVRRRRSVKAIETPQQVHFLLDYISYLQSQAQAVRAADI
ncbi:hypothetical protein RQP46_003225 [Phenoliferia psychrophenolica]